MLIKAALLMLLYPAAQVLWLGRHVVDLWATDSACCSVKEGLYGSQVQHTVRVPSFSSQLCVFCFIYRWAVVILVMLLAMSTCI